MNDDLKYHPEWLKKVDRLHFTLLLLPTDTLEKLGKALKVLYRCREEIKNYLRGKDAEINLEGVSAFQQKHLGTINTQVLYTEIGNGKAYDIFQRIINLLVTKMLEAKVISKSILRKNNIRYDKYTNSYYKAQPLFTLVNTAESNGDQQSFYSDDIIQRYQDYEFGCIPMNKI